LKGENKAYREQLEKSESQYRTITENIAEGVFTVDQYENFTYTNQVFCNMIGHSSNNILNKNLRDVSTPDSFKIIQKQTQRRKIGSTDRYIIEMIDKTKKTVHVELACSPVFDNETTYQGSITVVRDVTQVIELRKIYQKFLDQKTSPSKDVTPICASCKDIRLKKGTWIPVEEHFTDTLFSHGICPACCKKLYPDFDLSELDTDKSVH
ncbi:MAG: PAS domain S-box protein, partial [Desulfobacula sp.]|nr:PAS domain S-box protein [Desulfobacula sp.]